MCSFDNDNDIVLFQLVEVLIYCRNSVTLLIYYEIITIWISVHNYTFLLLSNNFYMDFLEMFDMGYHVFMWLPNEGILSELSIPTSSIELISWCIHFIHNI